MPLPKFEAHDLLRAFLIVVGVASILIGLFAPDGVKAFTALIIAM